MKATERAREAGERRDDAIRAAVEETSVRTVAAAVGLSPARVHQIAHGR